MAMSFASLVPTASFTQILKEVEGLKKKAKTYRDLYNGEKSSRTVGRTLTAYGWRWTRCWRTDSAAKPRTTRPTRSTPTRNSRCCPPISKTSSATT